MSTFPDCSITQTLWNVFTAPSYQYQAIAFTDSEGIIYFQARVGESVCFVLGRSLMTLPDDRIILIKYG